MSKPQSFAVFLSSALLGLALSPVQVARGDIVWYETRQGGTAAAGASFGLGPVYSEFVSLEDRQGAWSYSFGPQSAYYQYPSPPDPAGARSQVTLVTNASFSMQGLTMFAGVQHSFEALRFASWAGGYTSVSAGGTLQVTRPETVTFSVQGSELFTGTVDEHYMQGAIYLTIDGASLTSTGVFTGEPVEQVFWPGHVYQIWLSCNFDVGAGSTQGDGRPWPRGGSSDQSMTFQMSIVPAPSAALMIATGLAHSLRRRR